MSEMIERCAEALKEQWPFSDIERQAIARTVIAAMREPSKPMVDCAWGMISSNLRYEEVYRYLIDAALGDSSGPGYAPHIAEGGESNVGSADTPPAAT